MPNADTTGSCFVLTLLLIIPITFESAGVAKEPDKAPAASATNDANDPATEAVRAARVFLRAVIKRDDQAAYAMTDAPLREANSPEQFSERVKKMREAAELSSMPPISGWVLIMPGEGEPRRAMLASNTFSWRMRRGNKAPQRPDSSSTAIGIELVEKDGRWLITDVQELVFAGMRIGAPIRFMPGQEARDFAAPLRKLGERNGTARQVTSEQKGVLTDVSKDSVTIKLNPSEPMPVERTFKINEKTSVAIVASQEHKDRGGRISRVTDHTFASPAVLKVGNEAAIEPGDEDDYAAAIQMTQAPDGGKPSQ